MSTNLYPSTRDTVILEKLARVPAGTAIEHDACMAKCPQSDPDRYRSQEAYEADCDAFTAWEAAATDEVYRYHRLSDDGFGRVTIAAWNLAVAFLNRTGEHPATGFISDRMDVERMLAAQGVTLPNDVPTDALGGLFWS